MKSGPRRCKTDLLHGLPPGKRGGGGGRGVERKKEEEGTTILRLNKPNATHTTERTNQFLVVVSAFAVLVLLVVSYPEWWRPALCATDLFVQRSVE